MNIIFHHPLPLNKSAKSASGIRPLRMLAAFEALGCSVDLVAGYSAERKRCIAQIKENIKQGKEYDFVYSESSTMPTVLTDPHHLPLNPLVDWFFFRFCNKKNISVGLFYRDIYWLFDNYGAGINSVKIAVARAAYRFDLWVYQQTLSKLYLPSIEMGRYVPKLSPEMFEALPPGHTSPEVTPSELPDLHKNSLKLFYVGGMSSHYQLHKIFEVVRVLPQVELTVCTRESEWQNVKNEYPVLTTNIRVIHKTGTGMEAELKASDIAVLFVKPQKYWEFASPVKLYEYLGSCKPILASEGTLAGQFVRDNGIGWTISYEETAVQELLADLVGDPSLISDIHEKLKEAAGQHSWKARAQQVIKDLNR
jgi:glycosyltransferase involved in cell wall biosynthesis